MPTIHPTAIVETDSIGEGASVGEYAVIRAGAALGAGVTIHSHVVIEANVEVGSDTEILPGSYVGRPPRAVGAIARRPTYRERVTIGGGCAIGANAVVYRDVEIGPEVLIGDGASIRELCRVGPGAVIGRGVTLDRAVIVGEGVRVMDKSHLTGGMTIGDGAFISAMVVSTNDNSFGREGYAEDSERPPTVESEAMIGAGASLLPGVCVGRAAVVGSGAVVTTDVKPGAIVLGVPARPV
jgi:acetyltransferase-like isoleucine patch superfamily enzyme